ncbi:hypothetical protein ACWDO0_31575, partial [Nocardia rhamnosiphila]
MDERSGARTEATDPVAQMRRRLDELLAAGGVATDPARSPRPAEPDPQRARAAEPRATVDAPTDGRPRGRA